MHKRGARIALQHMCRVCLGATLSQINDFTSVQVGRCACTWQISSQPQHTGLRPLFAGESDLDQLGRVASILGTVNVATWPGAARLPDFGKLDFRECAARPLSEALPGAAPLALDLLASLLKYNPGKCVTVLPLSQTRVR